MRLLPSTRSNGRSEAPRYTDAGKKARNEALLKRVQLKIALRPTLFPTCLSEKSKLQLQSFAAYSWLLSTSGHLSTAKLSMRVRNSRAALLTDYEVLSLVREMEVKLKEGAARAAAAEAEANGLNGTNGVYDDRYTNEERHNQTALKILPHNLRQIQYPLLEALGTTQRPCHHQNAASIPAFLDAISAWERGRNIVGLEERKSYNVIEKGRKLTKGERLMLINHAPTTTLEINTIVEAIEERFTQEELDDLFAIIQLTLPLDSEAMQQDYQLAEARRAAQDAPQHEAVEDDVDMGEGYADEALVDDLDELENEGRGEGAVDDETKEDE